MVVPNDAVSTVVMFIAPGPPNPASTDVLYVAATRSTAGLPAYKVSLSIFLNILFKLSLPTNEYVSSLVLFSGQEYVTVHHRSPLAFRVRIKITERLWLEYICDVL